MDLKWKFAAGWMVVLSFIGAGANAATPAFQFIDFEKSSGWQPGAFPKDSPDAKLLQGRATIVQMSEPGSEQALQLGPSNPYPALWIDPSAISKSGTAYCEILAKPYAEDQSKGTEFLDFGGATLGFFKNGDKGEIEAFYAKSATDGVWISTGVLLDLNSSGVSSDWIRVDICLDRFTGRWSLQLDGVSVLAGMEVIPGETESLAFWLYGDEAGDSYFDDILLSGVPPNQLQRMAALEAERKLIAGLRLRNPGGSKVVMQEKNSHDLHQSDAPVADATKQLSAPVLRDWSATFRDGNQTLTTGTGGVQAGSITMEVRPYAPQFSAEGKPLPASLTVTADAQLNPGTDLSKLKWVIAEEIGWPNTLGDVLATGDFSTGLVQQVQIPGPWTQKATLIYVWAEGSGGDLHKVFKLTKGDKPAPPAN